MNPYYLNENSQKRLVIFLLLASTFGAGVTYTHFSTPDVAQGYALRAKIDNYKYVSPLLACQENSDKFEEFSELKQKIESLTRASQQTGQIAYASIYFRDPSHGQSFSINNENTYSPASLLKVPLMMAILKQAETDPTILNKNILYRKDPINVTPLIEVPMLTDDTKYSIDELIKGMIIDSDNDAKDLLRIEVNKKILAETYTELGIQTPYDAQAEDASSAYQISAKTYGLFFRVLYNATFLDRDMSEKALQILTDTKFTKGIRAGIPSDTEIAHKYGVRVSQEEREQMIELSDCGIIYNTSRPYILCIMTKGKNVHELSAYITSIAATLDASMSSNAIAHR